MPKVQLVIADKDDTIIGTRKRSHAVVATWYAEAIAHFRTVARDDPVFEALCQIEHAIGVLHQTRRCRRTDVAGCTAMKHGWSSCSSNNAL
jgi:hypothetical protein